MTDEHDKLVAYTRDERAKEDDAAFQALRELADDAAADIARDFPGLETGYDLWADRISVRKQVWPYVTVKLHGVIDMGDVYQAAFVWVDGEWEQINELPSDVRDAIIAERSQRGR